MSAVITELSAAEAIERRALESLHAAATPALREELGLACHDIGGALVSVSTAEPSFLVNRTLGLGLAGAPTRQDVARIRRCYDEAGIGRHFVNLHPDARPEALESWLAEAGYVPTRGWMKFLRGTEPAPEADTDLDVRELGPDAPAEQVAAFGAIVAAGFDLTEAGGRLISSLHGQPGWRLFMSFDGEEPAGTGALMIDGDHAWFDCGSTAASKRQRGGQTALLAARIRAALEAGCRHLYTETGVWVEGDPQHSYKNILKAGFREDYVRPNYQPA